MLKNLRRAAQNVVICMLRPYIVRELPGWGRFSLFIDYRRDWFWIDAPTKLIRDKFHGNLMSFDLSKWSDRSHYFIGRWYDLEMVLLMRDLLKEGQTVFDIGSNRGEFALAASFLVGKRGKVICFEPNPECLKILKNEIRINNIDNIAIHECGLSDEDNSLILTVPTINSGEGSFGESQYEDNVAFSVPVRCGDHIVAGETPSLLKIDVEGFETKVVLGLRGCIERCSPVVITEVMPTHLKRAGSSVEELIQVMNNMGYRGFRLALKSEGGGQYDWTLGRFDRLTEACDVVWLNKDWQNAKLLQEKLEHDF